MVFLYGTAIMHHTGVNVTPQERVQQSKNREPAIFDYKAQALAHSSVNTPATYSIYLIGLCLRWLHEQGGVSAIEKINARKAAKLYAVIDKHPQFYSNKIAR